MSVTKIDQLIIVGNGFDKSLGFPTSYREFLLFLLKKEFKNIAEKGNINGNLTSNTKYFYEDNLLFKFYFKKNFSINSFEKYINDKLKTKKDFDSFFKLEYVSFEYQSTFVSQLFSENENWGDIEICFFENLKRMHPNPRDVELLNSQLWYIKKELVSYLSKFQLSPIKVSNFGPNKFKDCISKKINSNVLDSKTSEKKIIVSDRYFINFNYTNFLEDVINNTSFKDSSDIISIHGNIQDIQDIQDIKDNQVIDSDIEVDLDDIIFGYGDEDNKDFDNLKNAGIDSLLKNIKTYNYQNNNNYKKLLGVLTRSKDFQVIIYGHSCSLSDRVLLREIFENDKCKSIRVLHHSGIDSYYRTIYNISRIFKENRNVREKVESFDKSDKIPQDNLLQ